MGAEAGKRSGSPPYTNLLNPVTGSGTRSSRLRKSIPW